MIVSFLYYALSAWFVFWLPSYATFKALSCQPSSESALQRWSMYWVVIGVFIAFEHLTEWAISWLPFYWELKTIFLLYLALPQTEGSTYIYTACIRPLFINHEEDLDSGIVGVYRKISTFSKTQFEVIWELVCHSVTKTPASTDLNLEQHPKHLGLSFDSAIAFWKTYSPLLTGGPRSGQSSASSTPVKTPFVDHPNVTISETL